MQIHVRSVIVGAALAILFVMGMGQRMVGGPPGPSAGVPVPGVGAVPAEVGRFQLVAADGRMWLFDTRTADIRNLRIDDLGQFVSVYVPRVTYDQANNLPAVEPLLPPASGRGAPARGR